MTDKTEEVQDKTEDQDQDQIDEESKGSEDEDEASRDAKSEEKDGDEKEDDAKDDKDEKTEEKEDDADKAPDEYKEFTIPKGFEIKGDRLTALHEFGKANNLSQERAQQLIDLHVEAIEELHAAQQESWKQLKRGWEKEIDATQEYQDEKGSTAEAKAVAVKAVEVAGGDELKEALELTSAGSHPAIFKFFFELGQHIVDDKIVFGGGTMDSRTRAQRMYPTMDN